MDDWNNGKVMVYIDNSNIFISTQKYSARKKKILNNCWDNNCRIDVGKLVNEGRQGRDIIHGKLYGSEPPVLDTVWRAIREKRIQVNKFELWTRSVCRECCIESRNVRFEALIFVYCAIYCKSSIGLQTVSWYRDFFWRIFILSVGNCFCLAPSTINAFFFRFWRFIQWKSPSTAIERSVWTPALA